MKIFFITTVPGRAVAEAVSELNKKGIKIGINIFYPNEINKVEKLKFQFLVDTIKQTL